MNEQDEIFSDPEDEIFSDPEMVIEDFEEWEIRIIEQEGMD